jgi:hypothetical protein
MRWWNCEKKWFVPMSEFETELLETELQRLKPAAPPRELIARLADALPGLHHTRDSTEHGVARRLGTLRNLIRWLAPLTAAAVLVALFFSRHSAISPGKFQGKIASRLPASTVKADDVEIVQQLVATFDAVAHLPSGEPVRFRCSQWLDDVVLHDSSRGILIQHQVPRLEVEPVEFETY